MYNINHLANMFKAPTEDFFKLECSGRDKDLDQWVFHPLLFNLMSIYFTPYLKYQIAENAKPCKKTQLFA